MSINLYCRWLIHRDLPALAEIEESSFADHWSADDFRAWLTGKDNIGLVLEHGPAVVGYVLYQLKPRRLVLIRLAVHPDWRRHGAGRILANILRRKLQSHARRKVVADVCEYNTPGQLFLRACGFRAVRVDRCDGRSSYRMVLCAEPPVVKMGEAGPAEIDRESFFRP